MSFLPHGSSEGTSGDFVPLHASDTGDPEADRVMVGVLAAVLTQLVKTNDACGAQGDQPGQGSSLTVFHALRPPSITIKAYLERVLKYAACSTECFVLALIYIDRIMHRNPGFLVTSLNVHRLLITAVMLAAKFSDDTYYNNSYYAKVGGVPCSEMNHLELEFLFLINFSLNVTTDVFFKYHDELLRQNKRIDQPISPSAALNPNSSLSIPTRSPSVTRLNPPQGNNQQSPSSTTRRSVMDVETDN